jgi:gluconate 2-dehydrogenase gamma chain
MAHALLAGRSVVVQSAYGRITGCAGQAGLACGMVPFRLNRTLEQPVPKPSRRWFLAGGVLSAAACRRDAGARLALTGEEARTLDAICDQLIPAGQDPGAAAAGAIVFIDRQLAGPYRRYRSAYREGLARAAALSRKMFGQTLDQLAADQRLAVVTRLEEEARPFFEMVLAHTMQGFYGSPRHGGNRDYASWRMLGVPASPVRGRISYDLRQGKES